MRGMAACSLLLRLSTGMAWSPRMAPAMLHTQVYLRSACPILRRGPTASVQCIASSAENQMTTNLILPPPSPPMSIVDATSIIAGSAIGGGFLALPSVTSPLGYMPTVAGLLFIWVYILLGQIAFLEAAANMAETTATERDNGAGSSVSTVVQHAFGSRWAVVCGTVFAAQMVAILTAQIVKGAEMISRTMGLPYRLGCLVPATLVGLFTFCSRAEVVERANTAMTGTMLFGFVALVVGALCLGGGAGTSGAAEPMTRLLAHADWTKLLPGHGASWALPVFLQLLCFGQAMPLVVDGIVVRAGANAASAQLPAGVSSSAEGPEMAAALAAASEARRAALGTARIAVVLGSSIPLLMYLIWAATSTLLVDSATTVAADTLYALLAAGPAIALPVALLAVGAIGTTLLGTFLAMSHFASDALCMRFGYCTLRHIRACQLAAVALPCLLACAGPQLYLPMLTFAGAYPTTLLYGLSPALAAVVLRRRRNRSATPPQQAAEAPGPSEPVGVSTNGLHGERRAIELLGGGEAVLVGLAMTAVGFMGCSIWGSWAPALFGMVRLLRAG